MTKQRKKIIQASIVVLWLNVSAGCGNAPAIAPSDNLAGRAYSVGQDLSAAQQADRAVQQQIIAATSDASATRDAREAAATSTKDALDIAIAQGKATVDAGKAALEVTVAAATADAQIVADKRAADLAYAATLNAQSVAATQAAIVNEANALKSRTAEEARATATAQVNHERQETFNVQTTKTHADLISKQNSDNFYSIFIPASLVIVLGIVVIILLDKRAALANQAAIVLTPMGYLSLAYSRQLKRTVGYPLIGAPKVDPVEATRGRPAREQMLDGSDPIRVNDKAVSYDLDRYTPAYTRAMRKAHFDTLELLRESIHQRGDESPVIATATEIGWGGGRWQRVKNYIGHYVEGGAGNQTHLIGPDYLTLFSLMVAVSKGEAYLNVGQGDPPPQVRAADLKNSFSGTERNESERPE